MLLLHSYILGVTSSRLIDNGLHEQDHQSSTISPPPHFFFGLVQCRMQMRCSCQATRCGAVRSNRSGQPITRSRHETLAAICIFLVGISVFSLFPCFIIFSLFSLSFLSNLITSSLRCYYTTFIYWVISPERKQSLLPSCLSVCLSFFLSFFLASPFSFYLVIFFNSFFSSPSG